MKSFDIFYTSDTHGHVFPIDYATNTPNNASLLNLASDIHKDGNTLLLDGGDSLQGTPLTQYYLSNSTAYPYHPVAEAFNAMNLDFYTLGNHDFNFGYDVIRDYMRAMKGICLCANLVDLRGELEFEKKTVVQLENGLKIGITGVVTSWVNVWEQKVNMTELQVTDTFEAARESLEWLKDRCDITVLIYHGGMEEDPVTGEMLYKTDENVGCKIARELDYDILLTGHQHIANPKFVINDTFAVQPRNNASHYIRMHILHKKDVRIMDDEHEYRTSEQKHHAKGSYDVSYSEVYRTVEGNELTSFHETDSNMIWSGLLTTGNDTMKEPSDLMMPLEDDVQKWLDLPIGELEKAIDPEDKLNVALHGSPLAALFNQTQLEFSGADFSCSSLGNIPRGLKKEVTVRDVCSVYTFANTVFVLEVTRDILKESLERVASYFDLKNGEPTVADEFVNPQLQHYNYDFYAGLDYEFDISKPVGQRVTHLRKLDGTELDHDARYSLVTSNYRATGTGGYTAIGKCNVLRNSTEEVQDLIQQFIRRHSPIPEYHNYKIKVVW